MVKIAMAVCALCRHSRGRECLVKNRDIIEEGKKNMVDCSWLREILVMMSEQVRRP